MSPDTISSAAKVEGIISKGGNSKTDSVLSAEQHPSSEKCRGSDQALSKKKRQIAKKRTEYRHLLNAIEFKDAALEFLLNSSDDVMNSFLSELSQMNRGDLQYKHHVPRTNPKVFEREAGRDGRIYYRRQAGPRPVLIELIGDKNSQNRDYRALQATRR